MSLEEQQQQLQRTMADMQATMESVNASMAAMAQGISKNAKALGVSENEARNLAGSFGRARGSVDGLTEAEKSRLAAQEREREALGHLRDAMGKATQSLGSFGGALLNSNVKLTNYADAVGKAGDAALAFGKALGPLGMVLGLVIKAATAMTEAHLKQAQAALDAKDQINKMGGAGGQTTESLLKMAHRSGLTSETLDRLIKPMKGLGSDIMVLGNNAVESQKAFADLTAVTSEERMRMSRLGINQEDLIKGQADYIQLQASSGRYMKYELQDKEKLRKTTLDYQTNLLELAQITGQDVESIKKKQQEALNDRQLMIKNRMDELKARDLLAQADQETNAERKKALTDEANAIRETAKKRDELVAATASMGNEQLTKGLKQYLATGTISGKEAAELAAQGLLDDVQRAGDAIKKGADAQQVAKQLQDASNEQLNKNVKAFGEAALQSEELGNAMGMSVDNMKNSNKYLDTTVSAQGEIAKKNVEAAGKAGTDTAADVRAKAQEATIAATVAMDKLLLATNPLIGGFDGLKAAALALTIAAGAATIALGAFAAKQGLGKVMDALGKLKPGKAVAKAAPALAQGAGGAARGLGGLLKGGARVLGKVAAPLAIGMSAYDAYKGFTADKDASTGDKFKNAGSSILNGLTFGLLGTSAEDIAKKAAEKKAAAPAADATKSTDATKVSDATKTAAAAADQTKTTTTPTVTGADEVSKQFGLLAAQTGKLISNFEQLNNLLTRAAADRAKDRGGIQTAGMTRDMLNEVMAKSKTGPLDSKTPGFFDTLAEFEDANKLSVRSTKLVSDEFDKMTALQKDATINLGLNSKSFQELNDKLKATGPASDQMLKDIGKNVQTNTTTMFTSFGDMFGSMFSGPGGRTGGAAGSASGAGAAGGGGGGGGRSGGGFAGGMASFGMGGQSPMPGGMGMAGGASGGGLIGGFRGEADPDMAAQGASQDKPKMVSSKPKNVNVQQTADISGVDSNLLSRFFSAAAEYGKPISVNSAYRGDQKQAELWVRGRILGDPGVHTPAKPKNDTTINYKGTEYNVPGSGKGSKHGDGAALDISVDHTAFDPILAKYGLHRPYAQKDPPHVEIKAEKGGVASGPKTGYPATLHGNEMIVPIDPNSLLVELGKKSKSEIEAEANKRTPEVTTTNTDSFKELASINQTMMEMMASKLDAVINRLETGNDTQDKLLKYSRA